MHQSKSPLLSLSKSPHRIIIQTITKELANQSDENAKNALRHDTQEANALMHSSDSGTVAIAPDQRLSTAVTLPHLIEQKLAHILKNTIHDTTPSSHTQLHPSTSMLLQCRDLLREFPPLSRSPFFMKLLQERETFEQARIEKVRLMKKAMNYPMDEPFHVIPRIPMDFRLKEVRMAVTEKWLDLVYDKHIFFEPSWLDLLLYTCFNTIVPEIMKQNGSEGLRRFCRMISESDGHVFTVEPHFQEELEGLCTKKVGNSAKEATQENAKQVAEGAAQKSAEEIHKEEHTPKVDSTSPPSTTDAATKFFAPPFEYLTESDKSQLLNKLRKIGQKSKKRKFTRSSFKNAQIVGEKEDRFEARFNLFHVVGVDKTTTPHNLFFACYPLRELRQYCTLEEWTDMLYIFANHNLLDKADFKAVCAVLDRAVSRCNLDAHKSKRLSMVTQKGTGSNLSDAMKTSQTRREFQCNSCGRTMVDLKQCSRCKVVFYCSRECQLRDWKENGHKLLCGELAKRSVKS